MSTHRKTLEIATVAVLADLGGRGFTHRAVDRRAGLPEGTASRYARTREALLELVADAIFAADVHVATVPEQAPVDADGLADVLVAITRSLLKAPDRYRARLELQLECARSPRLQARLLTSRAAFVKGLSKWIRGVGYDNARLRADLLIMTIDGLLHRQLILGQTALTASQLRTRLRAGLETPADGAEQPHV